MTLSENTGLCKKPRLVYAESGSVNPYYNLAFEKYLFDNARENEVIMYLWQNEKTVVCGRNQNVFDECNLTKLSAAGGSVARRLTGGGAVFHDLGNLNFTFIAEEGWYSTTRQLRVITEACKRFGIPAEISGRNDITAHGKKFSGNAFLKKDGKCLHHGTIMIDVDFSLLSEFLNVDREKLISKGVSSVKSRVVNLSSLTDNSEMLQNTEERKDSAEITVNSFKEALKDAFEKVYSCESLSVFEPDEAALSEIEKTRGILSEDKWIYGSKIKFTSVISKRFSWGNIKLQMDVASGVIRAAEVFSDSLLPDFILCIEELLPNTPYSAKELCNTVDSAAMQYPESSSVPCADIKQLIKNSI